MNRNGFTLVIILLIAVVIIVAGLVAYSFLAGKMTPQAISPSTAAQQPSSTTNLGITTSTPTSPSTSDQISAGIPTPSIQEIPDTNAYISDLTSGKYGFPSGGTLYSCNAEPTTFQKCLTTGGRISAYWGSPSGETMEVDTYGTTPPDEVFQEFVCNPAQARISCVDKSTGAAVNFLNCNSIPAAETCTDDSQINISSSSPVSWNESFERIEFDILGASVKTSLPSSTTSTITFSLQVINHSTDTTLLAPLSMAEVVDESGDLAQASAPFLFSEPGHGIAPLETVYQDVTFEGGGGNSYLFTTAGNSNIFFSVDKNASGTVSVHEEPISGD